MMSDLMLLVWLRWRHARGRADYWAALAGADLGSALIGERTYLIYLVVLFGAWFVAMMAAAASEAMGAGAGLGASMRPAVVALAFVVPSLLVGALGFRTLRSSPVKLTFPDIAYVGASALDRRAVALSSCLREVIPATLAAVPLSYLAGSVAVGMGSPQTAAGSTAVVGALLVSAVFLLAWAAGLARIRIGSRARRSVSWVAAPLVALALLLPPAAVRWPGTALVLALNGAPVAGHVLALLVVSVIDVWLVVVAASKMDMVAVIDGSALYAQLEVFRPLQRYDAGAYADIARRKRLAARKPMWHLPSGGGAWALVARALVSHVRQPGSLVWPVLWGAALLPYVAVTVIHPPGLLAYFPPVFFFVVGPSRQLLHVFQQDIDRPSLREVLPFDNLSLLLIDSVPVLAITVGTSAVAMAVQTMASEQRVLGALLCLMFGVIAVMCRGLERLTLPRMRAPIGYGISATISACIVLYAGAAGSLWLACAAAVAIVVLLGLMVRFSRE
ncbi:MAG: hypothetical protein FD171_71 [Actinobacteria bacterium]|nr:MAG: hypothetical protein FD171_71 [Actinomycetota bacterium]